ncbi:MAG: excalibur calcium-binding domain-containing protein [Candidatus Kerfeldbacteria bacterium]|nr:excalibur calcium-binding domain-containing protein [Candidatus Kerfeldbacteria bacterium]
MTGRTKTVLGLGGVAFVAAVVILTSPPANGPSTTYEPTTQLETTSVAPPVGDVLGEENVQPDADLIPTNASSEAEPIPTKPKKPPEVIVVPDDGIPYDCNTGKLCGDVQSCEEAEFYLNVCGESLFDEDGDGVPCEALCG